MLKAGSQRLAFLESLLHLRSKTFNVHAANLMADRQSAKSRRRYMRQITDQIFPGEAGNLRSWTLRE